MIIPADPSQGILLSPIETTFTKSTNRSITCNVTYPASFRYYMQLMFVKQNTLVLSNGEDYYLTPLLLLLSWSFNDGPLPSNAIVYDVSPMSSLLVLYAIDSTNDGAFTCMANDSATRIVNEDTAYISISGIITWILLN